MYVWLYTSVYFDLKLPWIFGIKSKIDYGLHNDSYCFFHKIPDFIVYEQINKVYLLLNNIFTYGNVHWKDYNFLYISDWKSSFLVSIALKKRFFFLDYFVFEKWENLISPLVFLLFTDIFPKIGTHYIIYFCFQTLCAYCYVIYLTLKRNFSITIEEFSKAYFIADKRRYSYAIVKYVKKIMACKFCSSSAAFWDNVLRRRKLFGRWRDRRFPSLWNPCFRFFLCS